jgi:hypothetical protein
VFEEGRDEGQAPEEPEQTATEEAPATVEDPLAEPEPEPRSTEQPQHQPSEVEKKHLAPTCFVSLSGESCHKSLTCDQLGGDHNPIVMTIAEAIDVGYEPCEWCSY